MPKKLRDFAPTKLRHLAAATYKRQRNRRTPTGPEFEALWASGVEDELIFWRNCIQSGAPQWPDFYETRISPQAPLQSELIELLPDQPTVRILDVGSGPLTSVGKVWPGHEVILEAVDALADEYGTILDEAGVTPPVKTAFCHSEHLAEKFEPDSFDLVCAVNTLDHSYDPMSAIRQMVDIGRVVYLEHHPNEAEAERYWGLHQWNFDVVDGSCLLWRPGTRIDLAVELPHTTVVGRKTVGFGHDDTTTHMTIRR